MAKIRKNMMEMKEREREKLKNKKSLAPFLNMN